MPLLPLLAGPVVSFLLILVGRGVLVLPREPLGPVAGILYSVVFFESFRIFYSLALGSLPSTSLTSSPCSPSDDTEVVAGIRMSAGAMGFSGVLPRKAIATPHVLSTGHRLQMGGIDAESNTAEMINMKPRRYGAHEVLIRGPVCTEKFAIDKSGAIPTSIGGARPFPATVGAELKPQAIQDAVKDFSFHAVNLALSTVVGK